MALAPGTLLDGYEILAPLGSGGMGDVYRARDPVLKREVAIKVLPASVSQDPDRLRRFEQEAQAAAALNHPNILAIHRFGVYEGAPYLVSELPEGSTLRHFEERGPLAVRKAIDIGVQIAHGLAAAHEKGIVHRDLKPENLFVTKDGRVKILDFGLAKLTQPQSDSSGPTVTHALPHSTEPGMVMGTVGYMAPEQVRGLLVNPHWSPDGKSLAAETSDLGTVRIFNLAGHQWNTVHKGLLGWFTWSKDSHSLFLLKYTGDRGIYRIPATGGKEELILDMKDVPTAGYYGFWLALDPSGAPLLLRNLGTTDIYALTLAQTHN